MSDFDPYSVLGLKKRASVADIRAAYRRLTKQYHPDAGGDPRQFALLQAAHDLLSDPERRRHWDKQGWDRGRQEDLRATALGVLAGLVQAAVVSNDDLVRTDVLAHMSRAVSQFMEKAHEQLAQSRRNLGRIDLMQGRFRRRDGGDEPFSALLTGHRERLLQGIHGQERNILVHEMALKMLGEFEYDYERVQRRSVFSLQSQQYQSNGTVNW